MTRKRRLRLWVKVRGKDEYVRNPRLDEKGRELALFEAKVECTLAVAKVQKLPVTEQADATYTLLGRVADALADFGCDPSVVAHAASDLAHDLVKRDGGPVKVVRLDPRRRGHSS